jgi:hypothetical protein
MSPAFICARVADTRALVTKVTHELRVARERFRGEAAQGRAIEVEPDALLHLRQVAFRDTR